MANQVVVSPLLQLVSDKLADLMEKDFSAALGVQQQMKRLSKTLSRIKNFVLDAEEKQVTDLEIRDWLRELKDAACTAEDVLEEWECQGMLGVAPEMSNINFVTKVTDSFTELEDIASESRQFHLQKDVVENREKIFPGRETGSLLTEKFYGREEDKQELVSLLLAQYQCKPSHPRAQKLNKKENRMGHISVCPILGIGGMGKTTLAKLVYNDESVKRHFDEQAWICISDDFNVKSIIKRIIASLLGTACDLEELDPLQRHLQEKLRGKRFLLVLDDVWQESQDQWNELKGTLACGAEGSCVLVTTRLETVASITATLPPYRLKGLSEDDCCYVFKQRAFGLEEKERPDLMEIGEQIVKKCKGVPLAAKALGASLRFKREPWEWSHVKNNEIWQLPENGILPALRLSYSHLPSQLRQCVAYCSLFKKGHKINRKELIQLWMANGFVQSEGRKELENAGNEIFEALLWRSFFQDIHKDVDGNIETCKMHDLVHDLVCDIAGNECSVVERESIRITTGRTRHVTLFFNEGTSSSMQEFVVRNPPSLRSLIVVGKKISIEECQFTFSHLVCLRALDLRGASLGVLPDSIGEMKHLRYLNLSVNYLMRFLPESVSKLINLETLNLNCCGGLTTLPKDLSEMSKLRHLDNQYCHRLDQMPIGIGKLTSLQTLSLFSVGLESGRGIDELGGLNNIGGELQIRWIENVKTSRDAEEAYLNKKENLSSLELLWRENLDRDLDSEDEEIGCDTGDEETNSDNDEDEEIGCDTGDEETNSDNDEDEEIGCDTGDEETTSDSDEDELPQESATDEEVMKSLQPPPNLRKFVVRGYDGATFPSWSLPKLAEIQLSDCRGCEHVSPLKRLPLLKVLRMDWMDSLKYIDGEVNGEGGFMSLEELELDEMPNMEGLSSLSSSSSQIGGGGGELHRQQAAEAEAIKLLFPCLKRLIVGNCPALKGGPLPSFVESITVTKCNESVMGSFQNLPRLSSLEIWEFKELQCFPQGMLRNLPALKSLHIYSCSNIKALPDRLRNLPSLTSLTIQDCKCLKRLPELNESCIVDLTIFCCPELEFSMEEDSQHFVVLEHLSLFNLPKLARFPKIKQAVMLQNLWIEHCSEVMDLPDWIGTLTSLHNLKIEGCKNRKVLPEGMQHLTALRYLTILGCNDELERRCKRDTGEDWYKIAHVQCVDIRKA